MLLDWCTHALTGWYNQKVEFSQNVLEGLWCYLDDLLHSRKLHTLLKQGKTISLRLNMAQVSFATQIFKILLLEFINDVTNRAFVIVFSIIAYWSSALAVAHSHSRKTM